jgi:hypothetical protein
VGSGCQRAAGGELKTSGPLGRVVQDERNVQSKQEDRTKTCNDAAFDLV